VRDTLTCPLVFHILPPTVNLTARPTVQPLSAGPVQPLVADPARQLVVDKLVSFRDSSYVPTTKTSTVLLHTFTYDPFGRPATHTYTYLLNGRPIHSDQRRYTYRPDGQLARESNAQLKYAFAYSVDGQLRELTYSVYQPTGWKVLTQTRLQEVLPVSPQQPAALSLVIRTAGPDSLQLTYRLAYQVAPDHTLTQSQLYTHAQQTYAHPFPYTFTYDTAPNPFQGLFSEHWYQDQLEHQGPHNLVSKQQNGRPFLTKTYTYNAAGYPTRCGVVAVRSATSREAWKPNYPLIRLVRRASSFAANTPAVVVSLSTIQWKQATTFFPFKTPTNQKWISVDRRSARLPHYSGSRTYCSMLTLFTPALATFSRPRCTSVSPLRVTVKAKVLPSHARALQYSSCSV
jgi:hypothetical protein